MKDIYMIVHVVHGSLFKMPCKQNGNYYNKYRDYNRFYRTEKERDIINVNNNFA